MKNLLSTLTLLLVFTFAAVAQTTPMVKTSPDRASNPTEEQMERYLNAKLEMDVQKTITAALDLDTDQTTKFQTFYSDYKMAKEAIDQRRQNLIQEYVEEMKEDDTAEDEENETADFVENYWELDIDAMTLKKNYFDRLEDVTGTAKALDFFAMDEMFTSRLNRMRMKAVPMLKMIVTPRVSYQNRLDDYHNWNRINIDGKVDVSHDFINSGIRKIWETTGDIARAEGITVNNFDTDLQTVMNLTDKMQANWKSLNHADMAREAFTLTAQTLMQVTNDSRFSVNKPAVKQLMVTAQMIDPDTKLTDQAQTVYSFFNQAEMIVNKVVEQANGMTK